MILKNIKGNFLFEDDSKTIKKTLEAAVLHNIDLRAVDLRNLNLKGARLDGMIAPQACFWGSDLTGADISGAYLEQADFRCSMLSKAYLAESDLCNSDFCGAVFDKTDFCSSVLDGCRFSGLDFFSCDTASIASMVECFYEHEGDVEISFSRPPLSLRGTLFPLMIFEEDVLFGRLWLKKESFLDLSEDRRFLLGFARGLEDLCQVYGLYNCFHNAKT